MKHTWKPENRRRLRLLIFLLALLVLELAAFPITSHIREKRLEQKYAEEARIEEEKKLIEETEQIEFQAKPSVKAEYISILERTRKRAHKISEDEFNRRLSVEQLADSMDIALEECREYLVSRLDTTDVDFEFIADTLWLNSIRTVLFDLELNVTTIEMMQANKYHREVTRRILGKYYDKLLAVIPASEQVIVKDAHSKWLKSIDADYTLAEEIASHRDGTMTLYTWSEYVDDLVYERIAFYYYCFQSIKWSIERTAIKRDTADIEKNKPIADTITYDKSLNEFRFDDWTDEDWYDNDYFRFLRKCFDDYCEKGIINNDVDLQDYKLLLPDQFFVYDAKPFITGGLFITLGFLTAPQILYETVVYSEVDIDTKTIGDFSLVGFRKSEMTTHFTKDEILEIIEENPETLKLW